LVIDEFGRYQPGAMGLADREYMRHAPSSRRRRALANIVGFALLVGLLLVGLRLVEGDGNPRVTVGAPLLGVPLASQQLYPRNDPWAAYLAPESACPGGEDRSPSPIDQQRTMLCLVNWARQRHGVLPVPENPELSSAARLKAEDMRRCSDFSHEACGREADAVAKQAGYRGTAWGENLYSGPVEFGRPRVAVDRWLNSPGHRENLLRADWTEQGVALLRLESFSGQPDVALWVSNFGQS
jgi:uncharacterized protein YkwD